MNTPPTPKPPKRYSREDLIAQIDKRQMKAGSYRHGILNPDIAQRFGYLITSWPFIEDAAISILWALLGPTNTNQEAAAHIFRAIINQNTRIAVMRRLLEKTAFNADKSTVFDELLAEFSSLNQIRNAYVHGLWFTHSDGTTYIAEATADMIFNFNLARPVDAEELDTILKRTIELERRLLREIKYPAVSEMAAALREAWRQTHPEQHDDEPTPAPPAPHKTDQ